MIWLVKILKSGERVVKGYHLLYSGHPRHAGVEVMSRMMITIIMTDVK